MGVPYAEVIGDPISHSKSPLIHNFWLRKLGLEGDYRHVQVTPDTLHEYLHSRRRDSSWRGCNVTMPLKTQIVPYLTSLDDMAEKLGAVNCVANTGSFTLRGFNTDVNGVVEPLHSIAKADYPNHVATYVQVIGAGGAARAAVLGALAAGYGDFEIFNRSAEKAHYLAAMAGAPFSRALPLDHLGPIRNEGDASYEQRYSHVVINATSMGMNGADPVPIDLSGYHPDTIVFDMVYSPLETPLIDQARSLGLRTIDGLQMLVAQAAMSFELIFEAPAPREHDAELRELLTR